MDFFVYKNDLNISFSSEEDLLAKLKKEYTRDGYTPDIQIKGNMVCVHIDENKYEVLQQDFKQALDLCRNREFQKAETLLKSIVKKKPYFVDGHRVLAQVRLDQGDYDDAIDKNIDALRIDPTNLYALLLMGNIYVKMNRLSDADKFYDKALQYHPENALALNNIAGNYLQREEYEKAIKIYEQLINVDDSYLNSYYGLAVSYYNCHRLNDAFEIAVQGLEKGVSRPQDVRVREELYNFALTLAKQMDS